MQNAIWPLLLKMEAMTKDEEEGIANSSNRLGEMLRQHMLGSHLPKCSTEWVCIMKPVLNFIAHLKRFNKVAGTLERTWTCTNSIMQGCSLSLLATAALSTVWARVLEEEVPTVLCNSIVDDRRLCATGKEAPKQLQLAIQVTRDFDRATGTRFNPLKSTCTTPTKQLEKEVQQTASSLE